MRALTRKDKKAEYDYMRAIEQVGEQAGYYKSEHAGDPPRLERARYPAGSKSPCELSRLVQAKAARVCGRDAAQCSRLRGMGRRPPNK
ncbi:hypothetical protein EN844_30010 [Mesorhizobium sp. M3A.F.Ca.ET.201.01.1.1]|uniref:hypothetical protein n=1 Tax=Mesorhizobium sp. M3A.F.Ca.ET.201.01.1.1 TaxID=2563946 RepID=UPI001093E8D5|nr:hypothetical protein [Mesorhizobium sp. M3A.F.Ca.ET.201.01.1.1]TGS61079.1 hypothetical protein EN844_30010 [Mesorhizobium sp. M3A.F.Ca.ET.201.01.1.1]